MEILPGALIPDSEFDFTFVRSSGPGGQNVNKVNSKAVLRWSLAENTTLPAEIRFRLISKLASQLTTEGEIIVTSDRFRDQLRNRADCTEKLQSMLQAAASRPKPRKKSKPSYSSQRRAKEAKSHHSQKKKLRGNSRDFE